MTISKSIRQPSTSLRMYHIVITEIKPKQPLDKKVKQVKHCKLCGATENLLLNGYCIDCEEDLEHSLQ